MKTRRQPSQPSAQDEELRFVLWLNQARDHMVMAAIPDVLASQYPRVGRARIARGLTDRQADIRRRVEREALANPI